MACARCDFYIPKPSGKAQMLEAKADVDRRLALIPLTDGERAAIEQDRLALDRLLEGLADAPTPAGPTPRELAERPSSVNDIAISPSTAGWEDLTTPTGIRNGCARERAKAARIASPGSHALPSRQRIIPAHHAP